MDNLWKSCLVDYLRAIHNANTRASYFKTLSRFFAAHEPEQVTRREIEVFIRTRYPDPHRPRQGELAAATQNARLGGITSFYEYASSYVPEGATEPLWNKANPTKGIARGKPEQSPQGLTLEELQRLFAVIPQDTLVGIRDRAILLFYLWTGRRRSELASMRYGDIQEATFPDGRAGWKYAYRGKGHKETLDSRELPLEVMEAISWYLIYSDRLETIRPEDPLFLQVVGNGTSSQDKPLREQGIVKRLMKYAQEAGLHAHMHTLRHTSAQQRYEAGEDIVSIMNLLGHRHMNTTYVYLQGLTGAQDKGAELLKGKFGDL